eukprot:scaffold7922_cov37-Phaeocystis_antarctica.AAC.1
MAQLLAVKRRAGPHPHQRLEPTLLRLYSRVLPVFGLAGNRRASPSHALRSTQKWSVNKQRLLSYASTKLISHREKVSYIGKAAWNRQ